MNKLLILLGFFAFISPAAQAGFWCKDKNGYKRPYLEHPTHTQHSAWKRHDWTVADWAPTPEDGAAKLEEFFRAGVLADFVDTRNRMFASGRVATLTVGEGFYHLSGYDQRRVVMLFDHMHQATANSPQALYLEDQKTRRIIGMYTPAGLQLQ